MKKLPIVSANRRVMRPLTRHTGRALVTGRDSAPSEIPSAAEPSVLISSGTYGIEAEMEFGADRLAARGFRAVIAPGFTWVAYAECVAQGIAPVLLAPAAVAELVAWAAADPNHQVTVDLETGDVQFGDRDPFGFLLDPRSRRKLLLGLDELDEMLQHRGNAQAFRSEYRSRLPWLADPFRSETGAAPEP